MKYKNISNRSREVLTHFNSQNIPCFAQNEVKKLFPGSNASTIRELLSDMTKRGLLMRIKEGLFSTWLKAIDLKDWRPGGDVIHESG